MVTLCIFNSQFGPITHNSQYPDNIYMPSISNLDLCSISNFFLMVADKKTVNGKRIFQEHSHPQRWWGPTWVPKMRLNHKQLHSTKSANGWSIATSFRDLHNRGSLYKIFHVISNINIAWKETVWLAKYMRLVCEQSSCFKPLSFPITLQIISFQILILQIWKQI